MADSEGNIKRQKRLFLHECTEEFEASRQDKVSFTLKPFTLRLRACVSSLCIRSGSYICGRYPGKKKNLFCSSAATEGAPKVSEET